MLLSNQYTEAVLDVKRKLDDISETVKTIASKQQCTQLHGEIHDGGRVPFASPSLPGVSLDCLLDDDIGPNRFRGTSSFEAHARQLKDWIRKAHVVGDAAPPSLKSSSPHPDERMNDNGHSSHSKLASYGMSNPDLSQYDERGLPLRDVALRIMRLAHAEQQRFFVDAPIIKEDELDDACRKTYFTTTSISIATLTTVNVGLYFLLYDLDPTQYQDLGLSLPTVDRYLHILSANLRATTQNLQLCMESSFESTRALSLLGVFFLKSGCIETGWRLISSASRMCLDAGMHLAKDSGDHGNTQCNELVRWLYAMNQALALTLGRPPVLRRKDVDIGFSGLGQRRDGAHWR